MANWQYSWQCLGGVLKNQGKVMESNIVGDIYNTTAEIAALLRVTPKTVAKLVKSDGLPASRVGRQLRFVRRDVAAWVSERGLQPGSHTARHGANARAFNEGRS